MPNEEFNINMYAVPVSHKTIWIFITISMNDLIGWGEMTVDGSVNDVKSVVFSLKETAEYVGNTDQIGSFCSTERTKSCIHAAFISALDQALFDVKAQRLGVPLYQVLRSDIEPPEKIPLYANINRGTVDRSPEGFARRAESAVTAGFRAIKVAPFDELTPEDCGSEIGRQKIHAGLERIAAVRERCGGDVEVFVDCHWRFTPDAAADVIPPLERLSVSWLECPISESSENLQHLRRLRSLANASGMRLAGCEQVTGLERLQSFLNGEAYDVVMPDVKYAGGFEEVLRMGEAANRHGVSLSLHNPSGPISHFASLHAAAASPELLILETQFDETPLFRSILDAPLPEIADGASRLPARAGMGAGIQSCHLVPLYAGEETGMHGSMH